MSKAFTLAGFDSSTALTSASTLDATKLSGTLPALDGSALTNLASGGITEVDQWVVTANFSGDANPLISNWARMTGFEKIGTGVSESSGVFTFPSTGIYLVHFQGTYANNTGDDRNIATYIELYDGSNYNKVGDTEGAVARNTGSTWYGNQTTRAVVDIADINTNKVRTKVSTMLDQTEWSCEPARFKTGIQFIRLGDT